MKTILVAIIGACASMGMAQAGWQEEYGRLLKKYVTPNGVQYAAWKASAEDLKALDAVTDGIGAAPASNAKSKEQLAFYINAYNAWILHEALEKYPTKSVKDPLFAFFIGKRIMVAGEKMSFNHLEKEIIRPRFNEPRVHFALNCASRSCPPLRNEPYAAGALDAQLEDQAKEFVNSPKGVTITRQGAVLSKIFDWYKEDFGGEPGVIAFINQRRSPPLPAKISYQEYDWNLNETR
jgi:hypothetical protein